ncbi:uncharacterized protein LOC111045989 [Nilaparvata lugens]|uniref:uncharacterized protein LOC111045989 n=1 Tax=Nilaparvata lugens TaxID=108931 RepID=UPI000B985D53|nr:uncharacterized protein LOC111045989 [Nilaparvata lugens]
MGKPVYEWYKLFQDGREDANDEPSSGRPSTTTDGNVKIVDKIDLRIIESLSEKLQKMLAYWLARAINFFDILGMKVNFVPKLLNFNQKNHRMTIAHELLDDVNDDPDLFKRIITDDKTWVYGYEVKTRAQSFHWKHTE